MRLLADESVEHAIVARLRGDGHEVAFIAEVAAGSTDSQVLSIAFQSGVTVITADKDFGELVYRRRLPHAGVLLLRLLGLDEPAKCDLVSQVVAEKHAELQGNFSVLGIRELRIRSDPKA